MHRPETWGYLQFSTAPVGTVKFRPDPAGPAKALLHEVYYKQHESRENHGRWAESLADLGLAGLSHPDVIGPPRLQTTENLFEVSVESREPRRRWHLRSDALVWGD
jgi:hypothetical protein